MSEEKETPQLRPMLCLGPLNQNPGEVLKRIERAKHVDREIIVAATEEAAQELGEDATTGALIGLLNVSYPDVARTLNEFGRAGCGYDLAGIIAEIPEDGDSHDYQCPNCGRVGHATRTPPDAEEE